MSHFNPLSFILNHYKLECPNYMDWKRNLDIVLTSEGFKYDFVEECSIKPADATDEEIKIYEKWVKTNEMARCYILTSISNVLQHEHYYLNELEILGTTIDKESKVEMILQTLPDSFHQFRLNYNMNKMDLCLAKLLNELTTGESIIKQKTPHSVAYIVGKPIASSSKSAKAQKKKKKSCKVVAPGGATGGVVSLRASVTTPSSLVTTRGNALTIKLK
ncbi:hypothetical protein R3W88_014629 [Solanum pinnatisectum]|uniref:UBN2 domain-containing protein n=1 Tax=Solanum pinnatisectum TaxID=50273 RepID=A0AAV9KS77_9SOLN|nr:hypothetical protein R3W88_014629 [Solanum pinnatisectum]